MSEVSYFSEKFHASQIVSLKGVRELWTRESEQEFDPFYSTEDPNPVKWKLSLDFGKRKSQDGSKILSVHLSNASPRDVFVYHMDVSLFSCKCYTAMRRISCHNRICTSGTRVWGKLADETKFLSLAREDSLVEFSVNVDVIYGGEFEKTGVVATHWPKKPRTLPAVDPGLNLDMANLFESDFVGDFDVFFQVGAVRVPASKNILSARNGFFRAMFKPAKEIVYEESKSSTVHIRDADGNLFKLLVQFLYTGIPPTNLDEIAFDLLPLADRFQVDFLKNAAASVIAANLSMDNVAEAAVLAEQHSCLALRKEVVDFLKENLSEVRKTSDWKTVLGCPGLIDELL